MTGLEVGPVQFQLLRVASIGFGAAHFLLWQGKEVQGAIWLLRLGCCGILAAQWPFRTGSEVTGFPTLGSQ